MLVTSEDLFAKFEGNQPANLEIEQCQAGLRFRFPHDFVEFLHQMNGGEGFVGKNFLRVWPIEDLIQADKKLLVDEGAPGLFLFGSDGGGEAFAFEARSAPPPVVAVPFIVGLEDVIVIAPNFSAFLRHLYTSEDLF